VFFYDLANKTGSFGALVFLLYILVAWLSITNIITSIFIDRAVKLAQPDTDDLALEKRRADMHAIHELSEIFKDIDVDHSNTISLEELRTCLKNVHIASFLEMKGLTISDAETFFLMLKSETGSNEVDLSSLISGWLRMRGSATNIDLLSLQHLTKQSNDRLQQAVCECRQDVVKLEGSLFQAVSEFRGDVVKLQGEVLSRLEGLTHFV